MKNSAEILTTTWHTIEPYLDTEASVAVAQTCISLYHTIIDAKTKQLKVSHFEVDNSIFPSLLDDPPVRNWHTAPARIPHYLSRALNSLCFQSLRVLRLDFPPTKRRNGSGHSDVIDDAASTSFPIFVTNLSSACNIEHLHLNAGRLIATERSGHMESLYEIFAENLCKCSKLKYLEVYISGCVRGYSHQLYSVALLRAVTMAIQNIPDLERLRMSITGSPSDPLYDRLLSSKGIYTVFDFLVAALSADRLAHMDIQLSGGYEHLNALLNAAMYRLSSDGIPKPSRIKSLKLGYHFDGREAEYANPVELQSQADAASLLELFSDCHSLTHLFLNLPAVCWQGQRNSLALKKLLQNKHDLSSLTISFSTVRGWSRKLIEVLIDCLELNIASKTLQKLSIFGLMDVAWDFVEKDVSQLQLALQASGLVCDRFSIRSNYQGKWDVMVMSNRRAMLGETLTDAFEEFQLEMSTASINSVPNQT